MSFATQTPKYNNWVNSNKAFWIAFNLNAQYIAANRTVILGDGWFPAPNNNIGKYRNVAVVNINSRNILGDLDNIGSRPIYMRPSGWDNYHAYMREGLMESITHEMQHNYIDLAYSYHDRINKIQSNRGKTNFIFAEENAVLNTSLSYFMGKGGFGPGISTYYYRVTFDPNIQTLRTALQLETYAKAFSDSALTNENVREIFRLPVLDN